MAYDLQVKGSDGEITTIRVGEGVLDYLNARPKVKMLVQFLVALASMAIGSGAALLVMALLLGKR